MNDFNALVLIGLICIVVGIAIKVIRDDDLPNSKPQIVATGLLIIGVLCFAIAFGWHLYIN